VRRTGLEEAAGYPLASPRADTGALRSSVPSPTRRMAEDILADLMGSFLIVAPAVLGVVFAYWLFKKVRRRGTPPDRRRARVRG